MNWVSQVEKAFPFSWWNLFLRGGLSRLPWRMGKSLVGLPPLPASGMMMEVRGPKAKLWSGLRMRVITVASWGGPPGTCTRLNSIHTTGKEMSGVQQGHRNYWSVYFRNTGGTSGQSGEVSGWTCLFGHLPCSPDSLLPFYSHQRKESSDWFGGRNTRKSVILFVRMFPLTLFTSWGWAESARPRDMLLPLLPRWLTFVGRLWLHRHLIEKLPASWRRSKNSTYGINSVTLSC